jgi:hypothetical protein
MSRCPRVVVSAVSCTFLSPLEIDMQLDKNIAQHNKNITIFMESLLRFSEFLPAHQSVPLLIVFLLRDNTSVVGGLEIRELSLRRRRTLLDHCLISSSKRETSRNSTGQ